MNARYVPLIEAGPEKQMAIDEAILRNFDRGNSIPTFRFFRFRPSAITLGYSQSVDETIDVQTCKDYDIPYVRRITGGGTVFHDYEGEITYSVVTEKMEGNIEESFRELLGPIMETLEEFGLEPEFKPYNDVLVNKKKISGSAQRRGKKGLLQHGTLMFATDLEKLAEILKIDHKKLKKRGADSFLDLVTTMEKETGKKPDPRKLVDVMKDKYEDYFGENVKKEKLKKEEIELADELENKYGSEKWLNERKWR
ncbi:MAG: lipoate--protein ligase family protein [Candidatus Natronoplasma sp.]